MRGKVIKLGAIILLGVCLVLAVVLFILRKNDENTYSCYNIPIEEYNLSWGMSKEDIIATMGEPASVEDREYGTVLTYNKQISSKFGSCSELILYVGYDETINVDETIAEGLGIIDMKLDSTTQEGTIEKLSAFYGDFAGGSTQMELDLKEGSPGFFNKQYYCDDWKIGNLSEEDYNYLVQFYQNIREGEVVDEGKPLMYITLSGLEEGDAYTCNISLDAYVLACLENEKK